MCETPVKAYLCCTPKEFFGNFTILTRQYREVVRLNKNYIFYPSERNMRYVARFNNVREVYLPCGKCIQCLNSRSKSWEVRSSLELLKYKKAVCLTLTYNDDNLPFCGLLRYSDVQKFIKRLRKDFPYPIKYMCSGEYGGAKTRPHYHIIIFNYIPPDIVFGVTKPYSISKKGTKLYKSDYLTKKWGKGFVDVGEVNHRTCRYVSQYCCKKLLDETKKRLPRYKRIYKWKVKKSREFLHCSIGFGLDWFKRNYRSVISQSKIVLGKFTYSIPRYFIKKLSDINFKLYEEFKMKTFSFWLNYKNTPDDVRRSKIKSERLLSRLNLFHSDNLSMLAS